VDTLLDVLRSLADGVARVGGIGEDVRTAIHDVINAHDGAHQAEVNKAAQFSEADQAELARLQAKQAEAEQGAAEPAPVPSSPLLGPGPAQ
jgi:hypothetical protein